MKIDQKYRPDLLCGDEERPVLSHCLITHSELYGDCIVSCDTFGMTVIPCIIEDDDLIGLVYGESLKECVIKTPKKYHSIEIKLGQDCITNKRSNFSYARYQYGITKETEFPDWESIIPKTMENELKPVDPRFNIDIKKLVDIYTALGDKMDWPRWMMVRSGFKFTPILVLTNQVGRVEAPFGLLMPYSIG